jgi:NAD+ diphosphatase
MDWQNIDIKTAFRSDLLAPDTVQNAHYIVVSDGEILGCDTHDRWQPLNEDELHWSGIASESRHFLGWVDNAPIFALEADADSDEPVGYQFESLWSFLNTVEIDLFYLIGRAKQIVEWFQTHRHCGQCGGETSSESQDRSRKCLDCGQMFYPRLSPSIIVCINKGEDILLAKNANARANFYSVLAGFVEPGESIEDTVHREVFEEVGLKVKNLKYFGSQSWPFPNSLMLGFHAEYDSGDINIQEEELSDAQWFHFDALPNPPAMISISGWLINDFIERARAGTV